MNRFKTETLSRNSAEDVFDRFVTRLRVGSAGNSIPLTEGCRRALDYYSMNRIPEKAGLGNVYVELSLPGEERGICSLILRCEWSRDAGDEFYDVGAEITWSSCGSQLPEFAEGFLNLLQIATELAREFNAAVAGEKFRVEACEELQVVNFGKCPCGGTLGSYDDGAVRCRDCDKVPTCVCGGVLDIGSGGDLYCTACGRDGVDSDLSPKCPECGAPANYLGVCSRDPGCPGSAA